jgi:putative membrane protein
VVTLPFGFVFSLGFLTVPIVAFVFYVLASMEIIAEEIEEPFGKDSNDLPMERLCITIDKSVKEIFAIV